MQQKITRLIDSLKHCGYIADDELATTLVLMQDLGRPVLVEGEAGVGKTAIAAALACARDTQLIRLQCYEGIDSSSAVYEWNYTQQLLWIKICEQRDEPLHESDIYDTRFLLERPLLKSIRQDKPPVLLIDEVDRADEAFEAFLLEVLSDFSITVPELGTLHARSIPYVILTSNGTRELSDALRRRCLFHYVPFPSFERELAILAAHLPEIDLKLLMQITTFVQKVRNLDIRKRPGVAETIDWARALSGFDVTVLADDPDAARTTLSCLLKTTEDHRHVSAMAIEELLPESA
jgi:MoxR-like ATPase